MGATQETHNSIASNIRKFMDELGIVRSELQSGPQSVQAPRGVEV